MANKFDMTAIRRATARMADVTNKSKKDLIRTTARGFVKDIVSITPPASKGVTGSAAKKAGEQSIAGDVRRIFEPLSEGELRAFVDFYGGSSTKEGFGHRGAASLGEVERRILSRSEMVGWHKARRNADGKVMGVRGGRAAGNLVAAQSLTTGLRKKDLRGLDIGYVSKADYKWFVASLQKLVGLLASGWNASATRLGVSLPAWVRRHGDARGEFSVETPSGTFRLVLSNTVPFVGNVKDYDRRIAKAVEYQANKMNRQADYLMRKAIKQAGF